MMKSNNDVIVFGTNSYNTLGLIRCLGSKGLTVSLLLVKSSQPRFCPLSVYVSRTIDVSSTGEGIEYLKAYSNHERRIVVIPTSDEIESELDKHYDDLVNCYIFPNAGIKNEVNRLMGKDIMISLAKKAGFTTPSTVIYTVGDPVPTDIVYPCFIKPVKSIEGSKKDICSCKSFNVLNDTLMGYEKGHKLLIQQYIDKEYDLLLLGCRTSKGETHVAGVFKKERWFLLGNDGSYGSISSNYEQYFEKNNIVNFLDSLNYVGPFSIEFGVCHKVPFFYEINLRNDGTTHYFEKLGYSIPYVWICEELGVKHNSEKIENTYTFIDEFGDFVNVIRGEVGFVRWLRDFKSSSVYKYLDWHDIKPLCVVAPKMLAITLKHSLMILFNKEK